VLKNVKEHHKGVDEKIKTEIVKDINNMHLCRNIFEFEVCKSKIYNKWITKFGLVDFKNYFDNQWVLNSRFNKWVSGLSLKEDSERLIVSIIGDLLINITEPFRILASLLSAILESFDVDKFLFFENIFSFSLINFRLYS
jgi:hypothetical protein